MHRWATACAVFISVALFCSGAAQADLRQLAQCGAVPPFIKERGMRAPVFSSLDRIRMGLVVQEKLANGELGPSVQLESWSKYGKLGPFVVTEDGTIFIVPVPSVNTLHNPYEAQNTVLAVNPRTGVLAPFFSLPVERNPSQKNPFGLVGMSYDCEKRILYLATVSGSDITTERGKIVAYDIIRKEIISEYTGIDALGVVVLSIAEQRALLFGSARSSEIKQLRLDSRGRFEKDSLKTIGRLDTTDELRARKFKVVSPQRLQISTTEFFYNLVALSEFKQPVMDFNVNSSGLLEFMAVSDASIIEIPMPRQ
jgi:hypothetical protein